MHDGWFPAPRSSSSPLTKPLRPLEYGFVEFSRQRVRIYPNPARPRFPIFLTRHSGRDGPTSDTLNYLPKTDVMFRWSWRLVLLVRSWGVVRLSFANVVRLELLPTTLPPDLLIEYARPRRDAMVIRGDSPDSADTAKSLSPPRSAPTRGRYVRLLVLQEIKRFLTPCPRLAPSNARLRYPIVVSNLSRQTRWQVCLSTTSPWSV